ncbi:rhomboid family intramembrane serine protease [Alisedimentitalea sp. MJ-SS2]|uniref:rhomboid family intramembrane serine protease n=1 Tax=Aliisedimentitalea sp. MJ-SS2 TaxID=3049795 RepID=UPI0029125F60|nr:rhomboid family intramembrane serine protease [Alisedimentitalea sp. MJ-SS2]MDU8928792.1 rhomboid family intramembrane serine protease [Alisedimentitalea sp. MJ-SS2]
MSSDPNISPVNPVSPPVVLFFLVMLGIEFAFTLGNQGLVGGPAAVGWRAGAVQDYAFNGAVFELMWQHGRWPAEHVMRFVTYLFVHWSFIHMIVAGVMLLALGKFVGEVFAWWAVAIVFLGSGIGGALVWAVFANDPGYLVGAFPGVYGLIGAFSYVLWLKLGEKGAPRARAFTLIGFLMFIQLVFGILFGARTNWVADLSGFGWGFLLSFVVSPGGWFRLRDRLRQR